MRLRRRQWTGFGEKYLTDTIPTCKSYLNSRLVVDHSNIVLLCKKHLIVAFFRTMIKNKTMTKLQVFPHHHRKTFTRSHFQNTLEDLNIPQIKIDASRKPKVVFYSLCQQLRSITDFRESLFSQCLAVRARQANEMLAKGYKQSSRFGRWDPVEVFVILFPFSVAVQYIVFPI